ncbi:MAG: FtsQ-type POTRA domain-containing protein [Clostridiales bacterium]
MAERRPTNRRLNTTESGHAQSRGKKRNALGVQKSKKSRFNVGGCIGRIVLLGICCLGIFFFLQSSLFTVKTIDVRGTERINPDDLVVLSGIKTNGNLFDVNRKEARERIELHAAVDEVLVNTRPFHKILITVKEKEAVAWIHHKEGYYLMDENGYLFINRSEYNDYLPLITGLTLPKDLPIGIQLKEIKGLNDAIEVAKVFDEYARGQLRELHFTKDENFVFFIGDLKVKLGKNTDLWKKQHVLDNLLQQIPAKALPQVNYIDVSSPENPVISGYDIRAEKEKAKAAAKAAKEKAAQEKAQNNTTPKNTEKNTQNTNGETDVNTDVNAPVNETEKTQNTTTTTVENGANPEETDTKTPVSQ